MSKRKHVQPQKQLAEDPINTLAGGKPGPLEKQRASQLAKDTPSPNTSPGDSKKTSEAVRAWLPIVIASGSALVSGAALKVSLENQMLTADTYAAEGRKELHRSERNEEANGRFDSAALDSAEGWFARALQLDEENTVALTGMAQIANLRKDTTKAIPLAEQALKSKPQDLSVRIVAGNAYATSGNVEQAKSHYDEARRQRPDNPIPIRNLATLEKTSGDLQEALALYVEATNSDPTDEISWIQQASIHHDQGNIGEAIRCLREAEKHSNRIGWIHYLLATLYLEAKEPVIALQYLHSSAGHEPTLILEHTSIPKTSKLHLSLDESNSLTIKATAAGAEDSPAIYAKKTAAELAFPSPQAPIYSSMKLPLDRWDFYC